MEQIRTNIKQTVNITNISNHIIHILEQYEQIRTPIDRINK